MARHHMNVMAQMRGTQISGLVEVAEDQRQLTRELFEKHGKTCPPFYATIKELLADQGAPDAAFINTPHKFHLENASDCLKAGADVLLEKPMVINATEARKLIRLRERTERLLVVAFPGSLSPAVKKAKEMIAAGKLGRVTSVAAYVHQHWKAATVGKWRQDPEISGGGFLFDTGSHMVNTVVDLIGQDVVQVSALMDKCGTRVDINSTVSGRFRDDTMFSLAAAGDSMHCTSEVTVMGDKGVLQTGIWGERLRFKPIKKGDFSDVPYSQSKGVWEQFLKVRAGKQANPCPPEVGLRFAKLMDMIRKSAETGKTVRSR
ncbi:MAG: gfo/Idh/MocA family oxidoreductase [Candidatus Latescibacteria bacterium]|nr:gfo/Idh/MocA family oxidoreductase [Candidatus Latescibacterota bacterium]